MKIIKAPNTYSLEGIKIFLAGTIEMGMSYDWQTRLSQELNNFDVTILNPRRDTFDNSQENTINNEHFRAQVEWELDALDNCNLILMYLDPASKSPISLMELGLYKDKDMIICCPDGFWKKGNIEVVANRYGITLVNEWDMFVKNIKYVLSKDV